MWLVILAMVASVHAKDGVRHGPYISYKKCPSKCALAYDLHTEQLCKCPPVKKAKSKKK